MSALEIPPLEGWVTVAQAADILDMTRQAVHKKILDGSLKSAHRIGPRSKPVFVLSLDEVIAIADAKDAA